MKTKKALPYIAGLAMAMIFGLSFLFSKQGLESLTPMVLLGYRFGIAALVLTVLQLFKVIKVDFKGKPIKGVVALSVFYPAIAFSFETTGLKFISTSQAGIMVSIMPIFVMIFGILILREHPTTIQKLFIASSVAGVLITVVFAKSSGKNDNFTGLILILISIVSGSIHNVLSRKYSKYFTPIEITFSMICLGAVFFNFIGVIQGVIAGNLLKSYIAPFTSASAMGAVAYLGVFASVIAFFCMNFMLSKLPAVNAAVFTNFATVISIIAGVVIMREKLCWYQIAGGILIIIGVLGTNFYGTDI